jgi:hypothetical protein
MLRINLQLFAVPSDIILGDGVFSIGQTTSSMVDVALTRGGGVFAVEREYRNIEADGDFGPVKGRQRVTKSVAKLSMKALEIVPYRMDEYYPSISASATGALTAGTTCIITGNPLSSNITSADYSFVTWTGYTKGGTRAYIELQNAINLENINWPLVDKDEVVGELNFTATYETSQRTKEPWKVVFTSTSS